jgi:hypothetical protein
MNYNGNNNFKTIPQKDKTIKANENNNIAQNHEGVTLL